MAKYYITGPAMSPFSRIVASIVGVLVVAGAIVFGFFVLAVVAVLGLLLWIGMVIRGWWLRRKGVETPTPVSENSSDSIEAEYTVISRRRD